jgi:2,5-furandicarboxylate decarboxylase 1
LAEPWIKTAIIVNKDVNIYSWDDVMWALATRVDFIRDIFTFDGLMGFPLDPMKEKPTSTVSKIGIDATIDPAKQDKFIRRQVVGYDAINLEDWLGTV